MKEAIIKILEEMQDANLYSEAARQLIAMKIVKSIGKLFVSSMKNRITLSRG